MAYTGKARPFWEVWGYDGVSLGIGYRRTGSKKLECWAYQMVE